MTSIVPFEPGLADGVAELWRALHPDWTWLNDPEVLAKVFSPGTGFECIGYVVQRGGVVIATIVGTCRRDRASARNRYIGIEALPESIEAAWLNPLLANLAEADRGHPDTWQVVAVPPTLWSVLPPLLEVAGFAYRSSALRMEWKGDSIAEVDASPARLERYAGGDPETDEAIVDLRNRSQRPSRLTPPIDREHLWPKVPGLTASEYVLVWDDARLIGYCEWLVIKGKAYINNVAVARSHWGTQVATAVVSRSQRILVDLGHREIGSSVISTNAPAMKLHKQLGALVAAEETRAYVRTF